MADKNIIVTGGAGYIGSHACKALKKAGYRPVAYDNLAYGHKEAVKWGPFEKGDLLDGDRLKAVFKKYSPSGVMHFAAFAYVGESVGSPEKYYKNNVIGSFVLLKAMRESNIKKFVFSSTCAVYGIPEKVPITEEETREPVNPYGKTKMMIEQMLEDYGAAYGLKSAALRYFNAAGADPEGETGEKHFPETHLIPLIMSAVSGGTKNVKVFGDDYDTPDGTCIRDYVHVADLASAHVAAFEKLGRGIDRTAINLGAGVGHSVLEIISAVEKVSGKKVPFKIAPRREGDPAVLICRGAKARRELGWRPVRSSIDVIIKDAWRWHLKEGV